MTYEQWVESAKPKKVASEPAKTRSKRERSVKRRPTWKEQREFETMESAILEAEADVERLEAAASDPEVANDHVRSAEAWQALTTAQGRVRSLYDRWAELEALHAEL